VHNLIVLDHPRDIVAHIRDLWQTDLFRDSHDDSCGYVRNWVERYAQVPRGFFEMTVRDVEHSHFSPWFGALHKRTYDNPYVHDLFVLHETIHSLSMKYDPSLDFDAWFAKMQDNELRTALESECLVYWHLPTLRKQTFDFEIWADRFLDRPMKSPRQLYIERRRAMHDPADEVERQMSGYPRQNAEWAKIWKKRYKEVESAMARLIDDSLVDRKAAAERYKQWLLTGTGMTAKKPYPFPDEAEAFAEVYRSTKKAVGSPDTGSGDNRI